MDFVFVNSLLNNDLILPRLATHLLSQVSQKIKPGFLHGFLDLELSFKNLCLEVHVVLMFLECP